MGNFLTFIVVRLSARARISLFLKKLTPAMECTKTSVREERTADSPGVKRPARKSNHSVPSSAEDTNDCN